MYAFHHISLNVMERYRFCRTMIKAILDINTKFRIPILPPKLIGACVIQMCFWWVGMHIPFTTFIVLVSNGNTLFVFFETSCNHYILFGRLPVRRTIWECIHNQRLQSSFIHGIPASTSIEQIFSISLILESAS